MQRLQPLSRQNFPRKILPNRRGTSRLRWAPTPRVGWFRVDKLPLTRPGGGRKQQAVTSGVPIATGGGSGPRNDGRRDAATISSAASQLFTIERLQVDQALPLQPKASPPAGRLALGGDEERLGLFASGRRLRVAALVFLLPFFRLAFADALQRPGGEKFRVAPARHH